MPSPPWEPGPGVLRLPSGRLVRGRLVRGRSLRSGTVGARPADLGLYLAAWPPAPVPWESRWLRWRDFWLPADPGQAATVLAEAWRRAAHERVEVA